jgi:hypothetical protein
MEVEKLYHKKQQVLDEFLPLYPALTENIMLDILLYCLDLQKKKNEPKQEEMDISDESTDKHGKWARKKLTKRMRDKLKRKHLAIDLPASVTDQIIPATDKTALDIPRISDLLANVRITDIQTEKQ